MGLLQGSSVYLIGSVENHKDPRKWRKDIATELLHPLGVKVYDPLIKPSWFNEEYPLSCDPSLDFLEFKQLLTRNDEPPSYADHLVKNRMWGVRELCLRMANDCNFIIASLPKKFTVGTFEEFGVAAAAKKPILLYLPDGFDTSTWAPAQMGPDLKYFFRNSFTTMEELHVRVRSIDSGNADVDNLKWMFLSYFNDEVIKNESTNHQQT